MASSPENRPPFSEPDDAGRTESYAGSPQHLAPSEDLHQQLAHWDELSPQDLARLEANPAARAKLQRLRQAQAWLEDSLLDQQECPAAEELFALAMPFAGEPLEAERRAEIQEHLELCGDCASEIQTLERRPPAPLLVDNPDRFEVQPPIIASGEASPPLRRLRAVIMGAAALMLIWLFGGRDLLSNDGSIFAADTWPETSTLRGGADSNWHAPRGKVLARGKSAGWTGALAWSPSKDAQSYRVVIHQNDGSAFDRGTQLASQRVESTSLEWTDPLPAGHYTVELFAKVFGLENPVGSTGFQVVHAPEVLAELQGLQGTARVQLLHAIGFLNDALIEAKALPEAPGRAEYIEAMESR